MTPEKNRHHAGFVKVDIYSARQYNYHHMGCQPRPQVTPTQTDTCIREYYEADQMQGKGSGMNPPPNL